MRAVGCIALAWASAASASAAQQRDTTRVDTLASVSVTVTRAELPLVHLPFAVTVVEKRDLVARPTWGLDEALAAVPGVFAANRYNFSLDQRLAIRGFGARSAFAVRGIKIILDGIPQTLPDGQGQLTHVDLGSTDRIEVLRGSASALYGNATGGVISIWTGARGPVRSTGEVRVVAGAFDRGLERTWTKWQASGRFRVAAAGSAALSVSRLSYEGERDHSAADLRALSGRLRLPLGSVWSLTALADIGDQPRADNPGALNLTELGRNRDTVPPLNLSTRAGKDVLQGQAGATLRGRLASGDEATVTVFGLARDLENPQTFAYIRLNRAAYGTRAVYTRHGGGVTAGIDVQRQRDDRANFGNAGGTPDTVRSLDQLEHVTELGPFVQGVVGVAPRTTLTAGLRYDRVSFDVRDRLIGDSTTDLKYRNDSGRRVMAALSGSLGATLQASNVVTLYASAGSSFETPTTTELANRPDTAGGFNRDLSPQRAWTYEVGARGGGAGSVLGTDPVSGRGPGRAREFRDPGVTGPPLLPECRQHALSRRRARRRRYGAGWDGLPGDLDLLRLPLSPLCIHRGWHDARARRAAVAGDPAAGAAARAPRATRLIPGRLGRDRDAVRLALRRRRHAEPPDLALVGDQRAPRVGPGARIPVCRGAERVQSEVCGIGRS